MSSSYSFSWLAFLITLIYLAFIVGFIFLIFYVVKLMRDRNTYLRDIRDELRKTN